MGISAFPWPVRDVRCSVLAINQRILAFHMSTMLYDEAPQPPCGGTQLPVKCAGLLLSELVLEYSRFSSPTGIEFLLLCLSPRVTVSQYATQLF